MGFGNSLKAFSIGLSLLTVAAATPARAAEADADAIDVLVLRENGSGSAATAQKFIDQVMVSVARVNGWPAAQGVYHTQRRAALAFIEAERPHFGILSLGAFLALRKPHKLDLLGKARIKGGGGEQYVIVSKSATDLAGCKGQTLATNHGEDAKFIDGVVAGGDFKLSDFKVVPTRRPLQTLKSVIRDEATCALIDDAQLAELSRQEGGAAVKPVWFSKTLPAMVVVAFPTAPAAEAKAFKANLSKVCQGEGKSACASAGIESLEAVDASALSSVIKAYD